MIGRVADQVHQRIADLFDDRSVHLGVFAFDDELDLFALFGGDVAHDPRQPIENALHRQHARLHDLLLELIRDTSDMQGGLLQIAQDAVVAELIDQRGAQLHQACAIDDQLTDEIERVQARDVDADGRRAGAWYGDGCGRSRCSFGSRDRLGGDGAQLRHGRERLQQHRNRFFRADQDRELAPDGGVFALDLRLGRLARQHATVLAECQQRLQRADRGPGAIFERDGETQRLLVSRGRQAAQGGAALHGDRRVVHIHVGRDPRLDLVA